MRNSALSVRCAALVLAAIAIIAVSSFPVRAGDIIADWTTAKTPPAPELKPVTVDGKTTALLILDMMKRNCAARPRCLVPVDGMSAEDPYNEQYAAWHLYKGGPTIITDKITLTRSDMIKF